MKVAIVQEWLVSVGGSEKVVYDIHKIFPDAPIYTLVYDKNNGPQWAKDLDIRTTKIQKIPMSSKLYKNFLTLMPKAWEELDLTEYDLIISSNHSFDKCIITRPDALHICYCHSPIRYVWDLYYEYMEGAGFLKRLVFKHSVSKLRLIDYASAQRVDYFIANSYNIANRIRKFYRREADVIYPGCPINKYAVKDNIGDYYLVVSRFVYYKRIDLAIEACNKLKKKLIIVGKGGEENNLKKIAGETIEFKGFCSDDELAQIYLNAKAFLFPGDEDFGITPVEAQSAGLPVLAYGRGGALETVLDGKTGLFFSEQTADSLAACIEKFENEGVEYSKTEIREHSLKFSEERFLKEFKDYVFTKLDEFHDKLKYHKDYCD